MKRAERMAGVRANILDTAKRLFIEQGYKKTTIRQIVEESGIAAGSIYNLFENKDDIFASLVEEMMNESIALVEKMFEKEGPVYQYAGILATEWAAIEKYPVIREIFYESHTNPVLLEKVVDRAMRLESHLFGDQPVNYYRKDEYRIRVLLYKGAMTAYIESFEFYRGVDPDRVRRHLAYAVFLPLGVKKKDMKGLLKFMESHADTWDQMASQLGLG